MLTTFHCLAPFLTVLWRSWGDLWGSLSDGSRSKSGGEEVPAIFMA